MVRPPVPSLPPVARLSQSRRRGASLLQAAVTVALVGTGCSSQDQSVAAGDDGGSAADSGAWESGGGESGALDATGGGPGEAGAVDGTPGEGGDAAAAEAGAADGDDGSNVDAVLPGDTVLIPPVSNGAILGTVTGYEISSGCPLSSPAFCYAPIYTNYNRDLPSWWNILVDELLFSRVNVVMAHGRGCFDPTTGLTGNGNMCPRHLSKLVDAVTRAGADDVFRVGMWDDTGAYQGARNTVDKLPAGTLFDLADRTSWRFFWDYNMKIWHDTVPSRLWYRLDGRPVVAFWTLSSAFFTHQQGNASLLLRDLRARFKAAYGEDPVFIVDDTWTKLDTTITTNDAIGMDAWFGPPGNNYTYRQWNGATWGALVPGFRDPSTTPGCGNACREVPRRDGQALRDALNAGANAKFSLLEGWTDIFESAGYYRSASWGSPNQYIGIVREYADPQVPTLRFQAEGADSFSTQTANGTGTEAYRTGVPNIAALADGSGWFVDWTSGGGWLEFSHVSLVCGTYRFTARVSAAMPQTMHLELDGKSLGPVSVPASGGLTSYELVHLGSVSLTAGPHVLRLVSDTGGVNADWFFLRRSSTCP